MQVECFNALPLQLFIFTGRSAHHHCVKTFFWEVPGHGIRSPLNSRYKNAEPGAVKTECTSNSLNANLGGMELSPLESRRPPVHCAKCTIRHAYIHHHPSAPHSFLHDHLPASSPPLSHVIHEPSVISTRSRIRDRLATHPSITPGHAPSSLHHPIASPPGSIVFSTNFPICSHISLLTPFFQFVSR